MEILNLYALPFLAVLLGFVFVKLTRFSEGRNFALLLAFSGAFLLALTIFHLLPQVYNGDTQKLTGLFIIGGILLQIVLEFFSKGAEHGHIHRSVTSGIPWMLLFSLGIHAFIEGMALQEGQPLLYGIAVHKLPVAAILSIFLLKASDSWWKPFLFIVAFGMMTPLGTFAVQYFPILKKAQIPITAIVVGVLLHISTVILFESSDGHQYNFGKMMAILAGVLIAYFI